MATIRCIIFDCDGVLVDSEPISNQVLLSMAEEHGLVMSLDQMIGEFSGRGLSDCFERIEKKISKRLPHDFESEYRRKSMEAFKVDLKTVKGVTEFIDALTVSYCVASSGPVEKIELNLSTTGLIRKFENKIFSSYQINSWKPDPGIFLHAARQMGFSVDECIVIEDSRAGVISGVTGGFRVFGLASEHNSKDLQDAGATIFRDFKGLARLLSHDHPDIFTPPTL
jgi:HAD superfamily hydrolase (TIGR01509 family)